MTVKGDAQNTCIDRLMHCKSLPCPKITEKCDFSRGITVQRKDGQMDQWTDRRIDGSQKIYWSTNRQTNLLTNICTPFLQVLMFCGRPLLWLRLRLVLPCNQKTYWQSSQLTNICTPYLQELPFFGRPFLWLRLRLALPYDRLQQ